MPEIKNTFLKSKMNKDLDDRLIPNGEYRDAQNLQISRSQGSSVGEFENVLGNTEVADLLTGDGADIIGQFTSEKNNKIYIMSAGYSGAPNCPRDKVAYSSVGQTGTTIALATAAGTVIDPQASGIQVGMLLRGDSWNGAIPIVAPVVTNVTAANITIDISITLLALDVITIGFANTIHELTVDISPNPLKLLAVGSFLNFSKTNKIFGINLLDDLLYWTDNRNQPRKINVELANPIPLNTPIHYTREDQISVAKYYPYETPLVLTQNILPITAGAATIPPGGGDAFVNAYIYGYVLTMASVTGIRSGDIVTGFPGQGDQELWTVLSVDNVTPSVTIYNNFYQQPGTYNNTDNIDITFSRTTMEAISEIGNENYFTTYLVNPGSYAAIGAGVLAAGSSFYISWPFSAGSGSDAPCPTPRVGDIITSTAMSIVLGDDIRIMAINRIELIPVSQDNILVLTVNKAITIPVGPITSVDINIGLNPTYDPTFTGDADLLEEKFVKFSYRFKYEDNEYSLLAPFTQTCFIPKQFGEFGWGHNSSTQDMVTAYTSTILEWFENRVDSITLKIPLPDGGASAATALTALTNDYKVKSIDILYKESDGLSTKIVQTIQVADIVAGDIEPIPNTSGTQFYYNFDYKSTQVYKTLPSNQENRVYDKVPIKALAQEISGNRVIYGNFVSQHTPPNNLDYSVINGNKSLTYNNYTQYPNHSVKQNRNYQVGFVLSDRVGRASSVILSTNDIIPNTAGSTLYIPYKSWDDIQITALSTYEWLGNSLNLTINSNTNIDFRPSADGQPGLYKSYLDSGADSINIDAGGTGYAAGVTYATTYNAVLGTPQALGSGLTVKVITIGGGSAVTGVELVNPGTGYISGEKLQLVGGGNDCIIEERMWDPNPLGWQSYKLVVKQQEQEYYNVYLPGFVSGYPVTQPVIERGRIASAVLLSDNINKVPRDLNEVGPLQNEFSASIRLFGRVNNPNPNTADKAGTSAYFQTIGYFWNTQYFPGRIFDEVTTIGPAGQGGLEVANSPFEPGTGATPAGEATQGPFYNGGDATAPGTANEPDFRSKIPWGVPGAQQSYYNIEQNPLLAIFRVGAQDPQPQLTTPGDPILNTLGAYVNNLSAPPAPVGTPGNVVCMEPFLSVSETEPIDSALEIFYESSTSENFVDLYKSL